MNDEKNPDPTKTSTKLSLAELLARSMEDDEFTESTVEHKERWDEDEGYSGG